MLLDGKLQEYDDGWTWAVELHGRGVKVLVLSTSRPPNAPSDLAYINKGESFRDVKALLARFLNSA